MQEQSGSSGTQPPGPPPSRTDRTLGSGARSARGKWRRGNPCREHSGREMTIDVLHEAVRNCPRPWLVSARCLAGELCNGWRLAVGVVGGDVDWSSSLEILRNRM
jgi:hypothetical protein